MNRPTYQGVDRGGKATMSNVFEATSLQAGGKNEHFFAGKANALQVVAHTPKIQQSDCPAKRQTYSDERDYGATMQRTSSKFPLPPKRTIIGQRKTLLNQL